MNYKINMQEKAKLYGLPHFYQLVYLLGIRPYMDFETGIVGIKRGISYQSLSEELYVEPHPGIKAFKPSSQQMRRAVEGLITRGLLERISEGKRLILKCLAATTDFSARKKADSKPEGRADRLMRQEYVENTGSSADFNEKANSGQLPKADTPPVSGNTLFLLRENFESFWKIYPNKKSKERAWQAYQAINPNEALILTMRIALIEQIDFYEFQRNQSHWAPAWKNPANWLNEHCWEDELPVTRKEKHYANTQKHTKGNSIDPLWESCKPSRTSNVIYLRDFTKTS